MSNTRIYFYATSEDGIRLFGFGSRIPEEQVIDPNDILFCDAWFHARLIDGVWYRFPKPQPIWSVAFGGELRQNYEYKHITREEAAAIYLMCHPWKSRLV